MHWTAGFPLCYTLDVTGPPPVMSIVGQNAGRPEQYEMFALSPHSLILATFLGGWEVILILTLVLILFVAKKLPDIIRGMGTGMSEFR
jgi:TatA/E family protein of Tat protein translocase